MTRQEDHHRQGFKEELDIGNEHQRFEMSGYTPSSTDSRWLVGKASYPSPQLQIAKAYSGEVCSPELAAPYGRILLSYHELYEPFTPPAELPMRVSLRRESSPALLDPINSQSDRASLFERIRGMSAADRRHSGTNKFRNGWPIVDGTGNTISPPSWGASKLAGSHNIPDDGIELPASNASENPRLPDQSSEPHQFWMSSPNPEPASPPANMLSPISPLATDVCPQSVSCHTYPHHLTTHLADSDGAIQSSSLSESEASPSMLQSVVTQVDTTRSENASLLPSVFSSFLPRNTRMESGFQPRNNIVPPPEPTRLATDFDVSSSPKLCHIQTSIVTEPTVQEIEMVDTDTWETTAEQSCNTRSGTFSIFDSTIMEDETIDPAWDVDTWENLSNDHVGDGKIPEQEENFHGDYIQEAERSDTWQFLSYQDVQLRNSLDTPIATTTSEPHLTTPQEYLNHSHEHPALQHQIRDSVNSHTLSVKSLPHCFNENSILVSRSAPKPRQVEELQRLVRIIHTEWMQRMQRLPELCLLCNTISTSGLFKRAVRALRDFICGRRTQDFEGIFAMMHLAFAAFYLRWQPDYVSFDVLLDDARQWQHVLPHDEDRIRFLSAMSCWQLPELEPTPLLNSKFHTCFASMTPQRSLQCGDPKTLSDMLRNSEVYKLCILLLEGRSIQS